MDKPNKNQNKTTMNDERLHEGSHTLALPH